MRHSDSYNPTSKGTVTRFAVSTNSFLPSGLSINETTGIISGIPTREGLEEVKLRIYNQIYYKEITQNITVIRPQCLKETISQIIYPDTDQDTTYTTDCPVGNLGSITRYCPLDRKPMWNAPNTGDCSILLR